MAAAKKSAAKGPKIPSLPKGFAPVRTKLDGFFEREKGNSVTGILKGVFTVKGKFGPKNVFRIEITDGETQVGEGEVMGPGATVGLDETGYTKALSEVPNGSTVYVEYLGKAGEGEKDAHVFNVGRLED